MGWVLFIVIGVGAAVVIATKTPLLEMLSEGSPRPAPAPKQELSQTQLASIAEKLLMRRIKFPAELIEYSVDDLRRAANFLQHEESLDAQAEAWATKQSDDLKPVIQPLPKG